MKISLCLVAEEGTGTASGEYLERWEKAVQIDTKRKYDMF